MMFDTLSARKKAFLGSAIQNRRPMMSDTLSARKKAFLGCPMQIPPEMAQICPPGSGKNPEFCIGHLLAHGGGLSIPLLLFLDLMISDHTRLIVSVSFQV